MLKVEAKSRARLVPSVVEDARDGLAKNKGRPNPETLSFIECTLRMHSRDAEAEPIARLQQESIRARNIRHLIFTLSGNDPTNHLNGGTEAVREGIGLSLCGCWVSNHSDFVEKVFDSCLALGDSDGVG